MTETATSRSFSRRSFIKGAATLTAAGALVGCTPKEDDKEPVAPAPPEEQVFYNYCGGLDNQGCRFKTVVRDGYIVKTTMAEYPDSRFNRICAKGLSMVHRVYAPERNKYPMRRVGERGAGEWERITWEEAIDEIASKWTAYREEFGPTSIAMSLGSGQYQQSSYLYQNKLINVLNGTSLSTSYDTNANTVAQNVIGRGLWFYGNEINDLLNSKCIVMLGNNSTAATLQNVHFLTEAQRNGTKLIAIDPNFTILASKADMFVPIRPATDAALFMAMINMAVEGGYVDFDYIKKNTVAPFLAKETDGLYLRLSDLGQAEPGAEDDAILVMGEDDVVGTVAEVANPVVTGTYEVNGLKVTTTYDLLLERIAEYTVDLAAEITGLSAQIIEELFHAIVDNAPVAIYDGRGPNQYSNGYLPYWAIAAFCALTGNVGKPGGQISGCNTCSVGWMMTDFSLIYPPGAYAMMTIPDMFLEDVLSTGEYMGMPVVIKSLYITNHNLLCSETDMNTWLKTFEKLEFVVVADPVMSDTAKYADLVLPVSHWFENVDYCSTFSHPYALLQERAIDPLYESKGDFEILALIGKAMGFEEQFSMTREEYLAASLNTDYYKSLGVTWENLLEQKAIRCVPEGYIHGGDGTFPTTTGRLEFYREVPAPNVNYGQELDMDKERLPYWEPPVEGWNQTVGKWAKNQLAEKYPLAYMFQRHKFKLGTQFSHNPWLNELDPEPTIRISVEDADKRGIKNGDTVRVFNDRGFIVMKAVVNAGTRPGVVVTDKGWQSDQFIDGHASSVTNRKAHKPLSLNNNFYDTLVEVEKYV